MLVLAGDQGCPGIARGMQLTRRRRDANARRKTGLRVSRPNAVRDSRGLRGHAAWKDTGCRGDSQMLRCTKLGDVPQQKGIKGLQFCSKELKAIGSLPR